MSLLTMAEVTVCKFQRSLEALKADPEFDQDDAITVTEWLAGHTPAAHIARDLKRCGYTVSSTVIKDHRRGDCACDVSA